MEQKIRRIGILTSGGDAPGMNAAVRAAVRTCLMNKVIPVGIRRGYQGLIHADVMEMNARSVNGIIRTPPDPVRCKNHPFLALRQIWYNQVSISICRPWNHRTNST